MSQEPRSLISLLRDVYFKTPARTLMILFMLAYGAAISAYFVNLKYRQELEDMRAALLDFRRTNDQLQEVVRELSDTGNGVALTVNLQELAFDEEADASVLRTVDYGKYALSKNDLEYAERLFEDAQGIQETKTASYYLGALSFKKHEFKEAIRFWRKARSLDGEGSNPDLLLYLSLAAYMDRDRALMNQYLEGYLSAVGDESSSPQEQ